MSTHDRAKNIDPELPNHANHNAHHGIQGLAEPGLRPQVLSPHHVARPLPGAPLPDLGGETLPGSSPAYPVSILLEFLEDPPESREAGLSHAKHREPTSNLPEVGGPTAPHSVQYIHLLRNVPHQKVASLAGEEPQGVTQMARDIFYKWSSVPGPRGWGAETWGRDMVFKLSTSFWKKQTKCVTICGPKKSVI